MVQFGLYSIKDQFFQDFKSPYFPYNKFENRPYFCSVKDSSGIWWMIPLSTQVDTYQKKIQADEKKYGMCLYYHIGLIAGYKRVFLIGSMFPITEKYIKKEYTMAGTHYVVKNAKLIKEVQKRAKKYLSLVEHSKMKPSIDVIKIRNALRK
ncbi:type III toxin-antitoxin system CptIN family toxin [Agathobaculum sp. Marseille-P7918]|uniref:type III toxin-antitoxin system CptIN family toxin n=1 Tax=Agathobaculum sp. Marseille-P7918 TaxID=2479843 RepID=UPI0035644EC0